MYRSARAELTERGLTVERTYVGEFVTSLQMAGVSVTVTELDEELLGFLQSPARSVGLVQ